MLAAVDHGFQTLEERSKVKPDLAGTDEKQLCDREISLFFKESSELWDALVSVEAKTTPFRAFESPSGGILQQIASVRPCQNTATNLVADNRPNLRLPIRPNGHSRVR